MKENFVSVVLALLLASVVFFLFRSNFSNLQTNIQGAEQELLLGDMIVEVYSDSLKIKANNDFAEVDALSMMIFWDTDEVSPEYSESTGAGVIEMMSENNESGSANIFISGINGLKAKENVIDIPVEGDPARITISDITMMLNNGSSFNASISTK